MSKIESIKKCREGVEIIAIEERGFTKRQFLFSLIIDDKTLEKIIEEMKK